MKEREWDREGVDFVLVFMLGLLSLLLDYVTVYYFCLISLSPFLLRLVPYKATL